MAYKHYLCLQLYTCSFTVPFDFLVESMFLSVESNLHIFRIVAYIRALFSLFTILYFVVFVYGLDFGRNNLTGILSVFVLL